MNFMFEWQEQYLKGERSERVRYCSCHKNIKFISSSQRVMFFFLYGVLNIFDFIEFQSSQVLQIRLGFIANRKYKNNWCQVYRNTKPNQAKFCKLILDVNTEKITD